MKWTPIRFVALALWGLLALVAKSASQGEPLQFHFQSLGDFDIRLPAEQFVAINGPLPCALAPGGQLLAEPNGTGLAFDRNGDGQLNAQVSVTDAEHPTRLLTFELDGGAHYALRARFEDRWWVGPGGAMVGAVEGSTRLMLIDQNMNGRFNDVGEDALVVGRSKQACFLSRVISIDGELHNLEVSPDGRRVSLSKFNGPTGSLDMGTGFKSRAKLRSLVLVDTTGDLSFEVSKSVNTKQALKLPAGSYRIHSGQVVQGKHQLDLAPGRSTAIEVNQTAPAAFTWGAPVHAEFSFTRRGEELSIAPGAIHYFGRAGELYSNFTPPGPSPHFQVTEKHTGKLLASLYLPGDPKRSGFAPATVRIPSRVEVTVTMTVSTWAFGPVVGQSKLRE